jgi:hypothetical protein
MYVRMGGQKETEGGGRRRARRRPEGGWRERKSVRRGERIGVEEECLVNTAPAISAFTATAVTADYA